MTLDDFEKELAEEKRREREEKRSQKSRDHDRHHHRSKRHDEDGERRSKRYEEDDSHRSKQREDGENGHRHKRRRRSRDGDEDQQRRHRHHSRSRERHRSSRAEHASHSKSPEAKDESFTNDAPEDAPLRRDAWMEAPTAMDIEIKHRRPSEVQPVTKHSRRADFELKVHAKELNIHLEDQRESDEEAAALDEPAQHEVDYTFGDAGSQWRMTRLQGVYRKAKDSGQSVEHVALQQYGELQLLDDAREEEIEMDRRATYGEGYVGKEKPSGELFQERKMKAGIRRDSLPAETLEPAEIRRANEEEAPMKTVVLDQSALNKLKADMMKAKLRKAPNATELEAEYERAAAVFANNKQSDVVVVSAMDNRMLTGGRGSEVTAIDNKRGRERGHVVENEDMSVDDMVRAERRTKNAEGGEGALLAERIAKDAKFDNGLEYLDENAAKLARRIQKSEVNLRNATVASLQKTTRLLDQCPLCHHEDRADPLPTAPLIALGTQTYLTLPTEPEISADPGAVVVPLQHRRNLLECDDDEWEELRNFMKALTRMYAARKCGVLFYENAAHPGRQQHAALIAVPLPARDAGTAPGFFREAILQQAEEWSQHRKLIDTAKAAKEGGMGRAAFRRSIAKQMPYFHVWFTLDGGLGHIVEDGAKWPKGDLFAREVLGEILQRDFEVVRGRGKWVRGDRRVAGFRKEWEQWDWTKMLVEE